MKVKIDTKEALDMLEGLGLIDGLKDGLKGALISMTEPDQLKAAIAPIIDPIVRQATEKALQNSLHGNWHSRNLDGELGKQIKAQFAEEVATYLRCNVDFSKAVSERIDALLDRRINEMISKAVQDTLAKAYRELLDQHFKIDMEKVIREEARKMLAAGMAKFGNE